MKLNLQQENFREAFLKMQVLPGWEIIEEPGFLALKTPTKLSFANFVWAKPTLNNIEKAKRFYGHLGFAWLLREGEDDSNLYFSKFNAPEASPEMLLDLSAYQPIPDSKKIHVVEVKTTEQFQLWSETAGSIFGFPTHEISEFFLPFIETAGDIAYLGFYEGKAAATSLTYLGKETAGLYAMGVLPAYRRLGLGRAVANACLTKAKEDNKQQAVLYSSSLGKLLYQHLGFVLTQNMSEYFFAIDQHK